MTSCFTIAAILVVFSALHLASGQFSSSLSCQAGASGSDVVQLCTGSGTLAIGQQDTYTFHVDTVPGATAFEGFDVDFDSRLSSVTGNVDLAVTQPSGVTLTSQRYVGNDVVFINEKELTSGTYTLTITGKATTSNYIILLYITGQRLLNPNEQLIIGQFLIDCCNRDPASCTALKQKYPTLADKDNSTNPNFCYMRGNVCSRTGRMEEFSLPGNDMSCPMNAQALKSLTSLYRIDLSNNRLVGDIKDVADSLAQSSTLQFVDLSNNLFTGNLSQGCGLAKTGIMEQICLAGNSLKGSIPTCILGVKALAELRLDNNALSGTFPAVPNAKSSKLTYLTVANQTAKGGGLNGSLPTNIADLTRLARADFGGNRLVGNLPGLPAAIRTINFAANNISNGDYAEAVPASYGKLSLLSSLNLGNNSLSGYLPDAIASIPSLLYLDVSRNMLSSTLPLDWTSSPKLALLKLDHNQLTGTVPGTLASLQNLILLDLSSNQFSGTLDDYAYQTDAQRNDENSVLRYLNVSNNLLIGPLTEVEGLEDLGVFTSQANAMASSGLPGSQLNLTLDMSGNAFSGVWPRWLFNALREAPAKVTVNLTGSVLTCPSAGFEVDEGVPAGYLDGLTCQSTDTNGNIIQIPLAQVVKVEHEEGMSGGAIFGIILAVFASIGVIGNVGWYFHKRSQRDKAAAAAAFGSNYGGYGSYPPQARGGAASNFSAFSDNQQWSEPSGVAAPGSTSPAKPKAFEVPLSQKGGF